VRVPDTWRLVWYLNGNQIMSGSQIAWTENDVPDQAGRVAVVTGANVGLGVQTARVLARNGAMVVLACRDLGKAAGTAERIRAAAPHAKLDAVRLDLASLACVREAAGEIRAEHPRIDLLILNAGVMDVPYQRTEDGFELTFGTNHLGHFALTGLLLDAMLDTPGSRVVSVSSIAHRRGHMRFDDLQSERSYKPGDAYAQSKLANLLFIYELDRRLRAAGALPIALAAHPGNAQTELWRTSSRLEQALLGPRFHFLNRRLIQTAQAGALPTLRAATDAAAQGGEYYGPPGRFQFTGPPTRVESNDRSHDVAAQRRLWEESERLTGVAFDDLDRVPG
jgi:NAD(P)-dependent dehydrogenase (short-subunit alcohol dehydrogenase family)